MHARQQQRISLKASGKKWEKTVVGELNSSEIPDFDGSDRIERTYEGRE